MGTDRAFHKAGPVMEKTLDPVLVFTRGTKHLFEFVERRYFEHFGRVRKSTRYTGWLSFRAGKVILYILKIMRNLTRSQFNCLSIGTSRLKRGTLATTLARQF